MKSHLDVIDFSTFLRQFLISNRLTADIPRVSGFPKNSCETACTLLALFDVKNKQKVANFYVVQSVRPAHYWIEFDGVVIDITLDQFEDYFAPIIGCSAPHPFNHSGKAQYLSALDFLNNHESIYLADKERFDKLFSKF